MVVNYNIYICIYMYVYSSARSHTFSEMTGVRSPRAWSSPGGRGMLGVKREAAAFSQPCIILSGSDYNSVFILFLYFILFTAGSFIVILNCVNSKWFSNIIVFFPDFFFFFLMHINEICWCWVKSQWNKNQSCLQGSFSYLLIQTFQPN